MVTISNAPYCLAIRVDLTTTVFFVRAADEAEAITEAHRIVDHFVGGETAQAELRRGGDAADWRFAAGFLGHPPTAPRRQSGSIAISR